MNLPETPAQLYDLLHERFGVGRYDEVAAPRPPWYQARMTEIAKLRAQLQARHATVRQVAIAAWYAVETGAQIRWASDLFRLIPEAMRAYNTALAVQDRDRLRAEINAAIEEAWNAGEQQWATALYTADANSAPEVLNAWRNR